MNRRTIYSCILLFLLGIYNSTAQVGIGTSSPHSSSILDIESSSKGFLPPRLTNSQIFDISSPSNGLMVYSTFEKCMVVNTGVWTNLCTGETLYISPSNGVKLISNVIPRPHGEFGRSIAFSNDGNTVVIGATREGLVHGAAYVFIYDGTSWDAGTRIPPFETADLNAFGRSVAISGDGTKMIISADGLNTNTGAAYIYHKNSSNWVFEKKITASDAQVQDYFGFSVAMNYDGSKVIVGSYQEDTRGSNAGAAYIFNNTGGTNWDSGTKILAPNTDAGIDAGDLFGRSVSMNAIGDKIIIGAHSEENGGVVYVGTNTSGNTWVLQKIQASNVVSGEQFGFSVSMSEDGSSFVVGANGKTGSVGPFEGSIYVFKDNGSGWDAGYELKASTIISGAQFGISVDINSDGTKVVAGSSQENSQTGAAYSYHSNGTDWSEANKILATDATQYFLFGEAISINGDGSKIAVGSLESFTIGSAYIYD